MNSMSKLAKTLTRPPKIDLQDDDFGAVLNCAVRYCIGRRTYMPGLVQDFIRPLLPYLSNKTLWCFQQDIERESNLGDPLIDEPGWRQFLKDVKKVRNARGDDNN